MKTAARHLDEPGAKSRKAAPKARPTPAKRQVEVLAEAQATDLLEQWKEQQSLLELQNQQLSGTLAELELSRQRYADFYDKAPVGYMTLDGNGCIREINQTAAKMLGLVPPQLMGRPLLPRVVPADRKVLLKHRWDSRRSPSQVLTTLRLISREGVERHVQFATSSMVEKVGGSHAWCQTAMIDVTFRKLAEQKFRSLLEAAPDAMIIASQEGVIELVNAQTQELFGYARSELLGQPLSLLAPDRFHGADTRLAAWYAAPHARPSELEDDLSGRRKDGSEFAAEINLGPLHIEDGMLVICSVRDVTQRKRAEQVIRRHNIELETRVEERTAELRRSNEQLLDQMARRRQLEEEILEVSEREQQRIGQDLHDDLGAATRRHFLFEPCPGERPCRPAVLGDRKRYQDYQPGQEGLDLTRTLDPVALQSGGLKAALEELTQRTAEVFGAHCRCKCPPLATMDNTTATHLYRIAQEAVTNAVKHGEATAIKIEVKCLPKGCVLVVKDNGNGLSLPHTSARGMGLRIMRYRAEMIGGVLTIKSDTAKGGTAVTCTFATAPDSTSTTPSYGSENRKSARKTAKNKGLRRR